MADFQEVCKHLKRMCERYGDNCIKCPLEDKDFCSLSAGDRTAETYKKAEEIVMSWAAEHPEPVYPTWGEWLISIGAARKIPTDIPFELHDGRIVDSPWETVVDINTPIPADIAQKLGIEPKEE